MLVPICHQERLAVCRLDDVLQGIQLSVVDILGMVKEGKLDNALAECQGFSLYPQVYGAYPWSLGPALSLFAVTSEEKDKKK